jgi:hypothetical protein
MSDPAYALSIGNMAAAIARGESADKIAEACANDQLNFRLQFTQAFRAELRTAISVQDPEVIDAS